MALSVLDSHNPETSMEKILGLIDKKIGTGKDGFFSL